MGTVEDWTSGAGIGWGIQVGSGGLDETRGQTTDVNFSHKVVCFATFWRMVRIVVF
jgi:hypothetical protein